MNRYFDHNATAPLLENAREEFLAASLDHWHNPSSLYREAGQTRQKLEDARHAVAAHLECDAETIVFTSGTTEANNAIFAWCARRSGRNETKVIISAIEHPSVRDAAHHHLNGSVIEIPARSDGVIRLDALEEALTADNIALVSVMAANNETGALQPWKTIRQLCRDRGVLFHCDAAQWVGRLPTAGLGDCDFLSVSAHKFGGPKGIGILRVPESVTDFSIFRGGPQEDNRRAGTENYPAIAGMLGALDASAHDLDDSRISTLAAGRDAFEAALTSGLPGVRLLSTDADRLWNTSLFILPGTISNLRWLTRLSRAGFSLSTGSACSAGKGNPSNVMEAMGIDYDAMARVLRASGGRDTTREDWLGLAAELETVASELLSGSSKTPPRDKISLSDPGAPPLK